MAFTASTPGVVRDTTAGGQPEPGGRLTTQPEREVALEGAWSLALRCMGGEHGRGGTACGGCGRDARDLASSARQAFRHDCRQPRGSWRTTPSKPRSPSGLSPHRDPADEGCRRKRQVEGQRQTLIDTSCRAASLPQSGDGAAITSPQMPLSESSWPSLARSGWPRERGHPRPLPDDPAFSPGSAPGQGRVHTSERRSSNMHCRTLSVARFDR